MKVRFPKLRIRPYLFLSLSKEYIQGKKHDSADHQDFKNNGQKICIYLKKRIKAANILRIKCTKRQLRMELP